MAAFQWNVWGPHKEPYFPISPRKKLFQVNFLLQSVNQNLALLFYSKLKKKHVCTSNLNQQMFWTRSLMLVAFNTFVSINFFLVEQVKTGCIMDMSRLDIILNDHNLFLIYAVMRYNSVLVRTMHTNVKVGARNCCLSYQLVNLSGPRGYLDI